MLSNPEWVAQDCESLNNAYLNITPALIQTLWRDRQTLKLAIDVPLQKLKAQIANVRSSRPDNFQTPLIPSRIYSLLLANLIHLLDAIERDLDVMLDAYRQSMEASRNAPIDGTAMQRKWFRGKALGSVVEKMKIFGYDPAKQALDRFIVGHINLTQSILMHVVAAFTGMRTGEVQILPVQGVLEAFEHRGSTHYLVKGYTHKLNNGVKRPASWITSREGHRAIQLAQRIARVIHEEVGGEAAPGQEALLFSSTESPYRSKTTECIGRYQKKLIEMASPEITQTDIDELNRLELERGWGRDGIEVGSRWPLAFHQLRRSLSVYAHRSGMVSLPSLKAQLQHITDEMRAYYSDGFCHAVNLVFDKDHFSHEWNAAKVESSYFGYTLALLFADEDLLGQGATQIAQVVSRRSREETLRLFQEGKLAYRETVLGGCVSTEECKTPPLDPIPFDCLKSNCINLVVASKRLDNVIRSQESIVAVLERDERGSVESRLEANNLKVLLKARQVLKENKA
ncbi:MAG: hypothetical protein EOP36_02985 [Rubrivivax sp.]|nr:MAG: hypothetical protein EOP36_02985 [Rubrivivax sp.]